MWRKRSEWHWNRSKSESGSPGGAVGRRADRGVGERLRAAEKDAEGGGMRTKEADMRAEEEIFREISKIFIFSPFPKTNSKQLLAGQTQTLQKRIFLL
jgi:hypothetical protein